MGEEDAMKIVNTLGLAALALVTLTAAAPTAPRVEIKHFAYGPTTLTVPVGATVTWVNEDEEPHTVTATGVFASPGLDYDETFSYQFTTAGRYTYHCALHPRITGTVVVQ